MDLASSDDDDGENNLDLEFRRILRIIKVYIPCIMNISYLASYRAWLEKLSECQPFEKQERNFYLQELCHQIQDGILEKPFTRPPEPGPLIPFQGVFNNGALRRQFQVIPKKVFKAGSQNSPITHKLVPKKKIQPQEERCLKLQKRPPANIQMAQARAQARAQATPKMLNIDIQNTSSRKMPTADLYSFKKRGPNTMLNEIREEAIVVEGAQLIQQPQIQTQQQSQQQPQQRNFSNTIEGKHLVPQQQQQHQQFQVQQQQFQVLQQQPGQAHGQTQFIKQMNVPPLSPNMSEADDESSWCDLSDMSKETSKMESGDSAPFLLPDYLESDNTLCNEKIHEICETRITDLTNIITELRRQNLSLNTKAELVIQNLSDEINSLRNKMQKFKVIKTAIKSGQLGTTAQWKNTIEKVNRKLYKFEAENSSLKNDLTNLRKKLDEFSGQKQKENGVLRQRLSDMYNKEIEMLKENYVRHIVDVENKYNKIINEKDKLYNKKLSEFKAAYEKESQYNLQQIQ